MPIPTKEELSEQEYFNQPPGFPFGDFDLQEVLLPDNEYFGIPSDYEDEEELQIEQDTGFGNVIVVDGVPVVGEEKYQKLRDMLMKLFGKVGTINNETGMVMPKDESTGKYKGFVFIEFQSTAEADAAVAQLDNFKLDKSHTFRVNRFDDLEKYKKVEEEYKPPEITGYVHKHDFMQWLFDERGRDQFIFSYKNKTEVHWNDTQRKESELVFVKEFWSEGPVKWSPNGLFLSTMLSRGIALWGGVKFERFQRLPHANVNYVDISTDECYAVTASVMMRGQKGAGKASALFSIWDVRSGCKLRTFQGPIEEFQSGAPPPQGQKHREILPQPVFKWSSGPEARFIAKMSTDMVSVYELPEMTLLDRKSIKVDGVQAFEWCPTMNIMCTFQAGGDNQTSRIALIELPSKQEVRQKALYAVAEARIRWHPNGEYLAVAIDRYTKTKKSTFPGFEFFRVKEKGIPMEVLNMQQSNDKIFDFFWENKGHKFIVMHGAQNTPRPNLSFYTMERDTKTTAQGVKFVQSLPQKDVSTVLWSPAGKYVVFAGIKGNDGKLEFFDSENMTSFGIVEHFMCDVVEWDPSGRFFVSAVTREKNQMENGFIVWSFAGFQMYKVMKDNFVQFAQRPRPPSLLSQLQEDEIKKNLKSYSKRFDEEDKAQAASVSSEVLKKREALINQWKEWQETKVDWLKENEKKTNEVLGPSAEIGECVTEMVEVEQELHSKEEVYQT